MDEQQPPGGISLEDWQATPEAVRRLVMALLATVEQLQQEVARLRERVHQTSQNSSKPPSSDPPSVKRKPPVKKGQRQRDGQPGHRGKGRQLQPPQEVSRFVISRRQVTALPRMAPHPPTMPPSVPCAGRSSGGGAASARKVRLAVALGERIQTAVTSLRQQHRDVLDFLTQACQAAISRSDPPSSLPAV